MTKKFKRILVMGDNHSGLISGLCPERYQFKVVENSKDELTKKRNKNALFQKELWNWYTKTLKSLQPIDILFHLGDAIDGDGKRSGGTELITTDQIQQCEMAVECIDQVRAKDIYICYGTGYHSGNDMDYEDVIAERVNAKIGSHHWISVNGVLFDLKHKIGAGSVPHTRATPILRDKLWNVMWNEKDLQPKSDVLIRGHVHYDSFVGSNDFLGITIPSLSWNTKFGTRSCSGVVSIGLTVFDVYSDGKYNWWFEIAKLPLQKVETVKI